MENTCYDTLCENNVRRLNIMRSNGKRKFFYYSIEETGNYFTLFKRRRKGELRFTPISPAIPTEIIAYLILRDYGGEKNADIKFELLSRFIDISQESVDLIIIEMSLSKVGENG